jgi:hypothetical protein
MLFEEWTVGTGGRPQIADRIERFVQNSALSPPTLGDRWTLTSTKDGVGHAKQKITPTSRGKRGILEAQQGKRNGIKTECRKSKVRKRRRWKSDERNSWSGAYASGKDGCNRGV